jgi:uncharacterized membrane protein
MSEQRQHRGLSDERVDGIISDLLRIGVIASAVIVFSGGILYLVSEGGKPAPDLHEFQKQPEKLRNPVHIVREAASLSELGLIMLGLLLLIATPVARVIFSVAAFALQRDYLYVLFTLLVMSVLLYSLFSGYLSGEAAL